MRRLPAIQLAVAAWCAWQARELLVAWRDSPYDRFGWLALILWATPLAVAGFRRDGGQPRLWPSFVAIAATFVGLIGWFNTLAYAGLALALAALRAPTPRWAAWVASAAAWWPAFGYALKGLPLAAVPGVRALVATVGVAILLWSPRPAATEPR